MPHVKLIVLLDNVMMLMFICNIILHQTIGLILCQDKKKVLAEYALRGMTQPIGVSEYELTRSLPDELKSVLPTIEELESELTDFSNGGK